MSDTWFDIAYQFENGVGLVKQEGQYNFIKTDGKLFSDFWFDNLYTTDIGYGFAIARLGKQHYWVKSNGILCDYNTNEPLFDMFNKKFI